MRQRVSDDVIAAVRAMPLTDALDAIGAYWKADTTFRPAKDARTARLHVTINGRGVELLITGARWYDSRSRHGGGGAIDLAMHLLGVDFGEVVRRLRRGGRK